MDNIVDRTGAGKRYVPAANQVYATLLLNAAACLFGIATDRKAWVFCDDEGSMFKTLQDSSGDGTIPENSVLLADANGRATNDTNLTYDGTTFQFPLPLTLAFGDQSTNGSMRIRVATEGVFFEKRISGTWTELGVFF